jgi:hypothetical protein
VPPAWWAALSEDRLPGEGPEDRSRPGWSARLQGVGARLGVPVFLLSVVGAVVAAGFGYLVVAGALGAAVVVGLVVATALHQRGLAEPQGPNWWR